MVIHRSASSEVSSYSGSVDGTISVEETGEGGRLTLATYILPQALMTRSKRYLTSPRRMRYLTRTTPT